MATEGKSKHSNNNRKRKNYLPHNKPVKKGAYPLRPGVEGFFITCDGGREYQASHEAINVIDSFYEELVEGTELKVERVHAPTKPLNKITKFNSDSSSSDDDEDGDDDKADTGNVDSNNGHPKESEGVQATEDENGNANSANVDTGAVSGPTDGVLTEKKNEESNKSDNKDAVEAVEPPLKKQCKEVDTPNSGNLPTKVEIKSVDRLIEEELAELGDKSKRRFNKLDTGCNGVVFIQMRKREGDPCPKDIVQHMMTSLAMTKKHVSRFLLRMLPVEVTCYTSDDEIKRAIKPLVDKYFPVETEAPRKFAVAYDARANTGIDRAKVIDAVAKSVPSVHKVDLAKPEITIMVQIVKTVCLIGVVEKYKELSKYNIRQLTSS